MAYHRGAWIPDGTAGVVVVLLVFAFVVVLLGYGLWRQHRRGR
jgi:hypothetical protein